MITANNIRIEFEQTELGKIQYFLSNGIESNRFDKITSKNNKFIGKSLGATFEINNKTLKSRRIYV